MGIRTWEGAGFSSFLLENGFEPFKLCKGCTAFYETALSFQFGLIFCAALYACSVQARRISVRPVSQEQEEESVQYYTAAEPQDDEQVVLVSTADQYNGLYGQPSASRNIQENYIPSSRSPHKSQAVSVKTKEQPKSPPVQTIRNYNKVNDDGSFTFGYEAADGSFKEETRGTDCVVRGKYGYIDPDGNRREFTYVSGNPCDPNAPKEESQEEESAERQSNEAEDASPNYPTRPIRPIRPTTTPRPVSVFQNNYVQEEEEEELEQVIRPTVQVGNGVGIESWWWNRFVFLAASLASLHIPTAIRFKLRRGRGTPGVSHTDSVRRSFHDAFVGVVQANHNSCQHHSQAGCFQHFSGGIAGNHLQTPASASRRDAKAFDAVHQAVYNALADSGVFHCFASGGDQQEQHRLRVRVPEVPASEHHRVF